MREMRLQPCRNEDIEAVLALWLRSGAVPRPTDTPHHLAIRLRRDADLFLLAWDGDSLIGSLMGGWDGWRGTMYRLVVDPPYRRRGIARQLVEKMEAALVSNGAERMTILVFHEEAGAVAFWEALGYEADPSTHRFAKHLAG